MKQFKRSISTLLLAATLGTGATMIPTSQAQAGVLLTPLLVGIVLIAYGAKYDNAAEVVLDADGNVSQGALERNLAAAYPFIDDRDVVRDLATALRDKAASTEPVNGQKMVRLSRSEVMALLAPTGLAELQPDAVEGLVRDLE